MNGRQVAGTVLDTVLKIVIIIAVVMFTYKYATQAYDFGSRLFASQPMAAEENARAIRIALTEEATTMDIAEVLQSKGLIEDAKVFYVQELLSKYHDELKPGIYELSSDMTAEEMMAVMAAQPAAEEETETGEASGSGETQDDG